jgi:hypothetical protein
MAMINKIPTTQTNKDLQGAQRQQAVFFAHVAHRDAGNCVGNVGSASSSFPISSSRR